MPDERTDQVFYAAARVDDVLDDNDMASPEVVGQPDQLLHRPRGRGAVVRGQLDERDLTGEIDMLEQLGHIHKRTVEHSQKQGALPPGIIAVDPLGDFPDRSDQSVVRNGEPECFVVQADGLGCSHIREILSRTACVKSAVCAYLCAKLAINRQ